MPVRPLNLPALGLFLLLLVLGVVHAQQSAPASGESLTLDQAIALALRENHGMKIAKLEVERADEDISAAKTYRLPSLHAYTSVSGNLANNELKVPNPANNLFPGLGPFFTLNDRRKPTAIFAASVIEPLTQQYRIGLNIKLERVSRELAQAKLRQQQNELRADLLTVQTRLAKVEYEQLELSNQLATQKDQLNSLLGRAVDTSFEVAGVP